MMNPETKINVALTVLFSDIKDPANREVEAEARKVILDFLKK